ncbi:MAG: 4-coumarate--CoA ligase family protein [Geodermatophilaceae bacterium]|nr:4-coumarate--CoA ligase family protein [Geodermatophilaceae bacterium]
MTLASSFPDIEIPDVSVPAYVLRNAGQHADRQALVDGTTGDSLSYGQLAAYVDRVAAALVERGVKPGDTVAIFSPNTMYYPVVFHGVAATGALSTTINSLYTPDEIAFQLKDSNASVLITVSPFLDRAKAATEKHPVREIIVMDGAEGHASMRDLLTSKAPSPQVSINASEDLVTLPYSSGTTGLPKGVMLTHRNLVANCAQCEPVLEISGDERLIAVLPFFHIYGLTVLMNLGLSSGATVVTLPRFDLEQFLQVLQDQKITRAYVAPPIVLALAKHPLVDKFDLSALRVVFSGAAPLDEELARACATRLGCTVKQGYGMTEMSPVSHAMPDGQDCPLGSVGMALPNTESRLVSVDTGEDVGPGEPGELWVRGPQVMLGYLNNDEATAHTKDADGWLHTGDVAVVDEQGVFSIGDRVKELIKYKGYQVAPAELEAVLVGNPRIADAAVIGVNDQASGEIPKAFVVVAAGQEITAEEVMAYVTEHVAPHKKVRLVEFIETIPKSASGKILRKDLRARG